MALTATKCKKKRGLRTDVAMRRIKIIAEVNNEPRYRYKTVSRVADRFHVSRWTAARDLEWLRRHGILWRKHEEYQYGETLEQFVERVHYVMNQALSATKM
jgi:DeoR/GlpR family transcriptional regulator of sugar metabolism